MELERVVGSGRRDLRVWDEFCKGGGSRGDGAAVRDPDHLFPGSCFDDLADLVGPIWEGDDGVDRGFVVAGGEEEEPRGGDVFFARDEDAEGDKGADAAVDKHALAGCASVCRVGLAEFADDDRNEEDTKEDAKDDADKVDDPKGRVCGGRAG